VLGDARGPSWAVAIVLASLCVACADDAAGTGTAGAAGSAGPGSSGSGAGPAGSGATGQAGRAGSTSSSGAGDGGGSAGSGEPGSGRAGTSGAAGTASSESGASGGDAGAGGSGERCELECPPNSRCELVQVACIRAPCPPMPTCVEVSTGAEAGAGGGEGIRCTGALCRRAPPTCPTFQVPSVVGTCFGDCVPIESCPCSGPDDCPDRNQYTCHMSEQHCTPHL
jgi:hypothetical protein